MGLVFKRFVRISVKLTGALSVRFNFLLGFGFIEIAIGIEIDFCLPIRLGVYIAY